MACIIQPRRDESLNPFPSWSIHPDYPQEWERRIQYNEPTSMGHVFFIHHQHLNNIISSIYPHIRPIASVGSKERVVVSATSWPRWCHLAHKASSDLVLVIKHGETFGGMTLLIYIVHVWRLQCSSCSGGRIFGIPESYVRIRILICVILLSKLNKLTDS